MAALLLTCAVQPAWAGHKCHADPLRNLRSGQTLHCANGTVQVSLVTQEPQPQQTYNLVVADFDTYFVGAERIFTHDVTERKPTRSIVPGLARN